jgi:hypothetical protein
MAIYPRFFADELTRQPGYPALRRFLVPLIAASFAISPVALAATMSASAVPPPRLGDDISNIPDLPPGVTTGTDKWWPDSATAFGNPGMTVGQTFTTGNGALMLKAVTFRISPATAPAKTYTIRVGTVSGSTFTTIASETATQGFATTANDYWTWTFATPVLLSPNTLYGVDVGFNSSTSSYTTGIPYVYYTTADSYSSGNRFRSGSAGNGVGNNTISQTTGDRIFHLALERPLGSNFELVATSPADNETGVLASRNLVLTFSQDIAPGSGNLILRNLGDATETVIPAGDSRLSYEENVLTLNSTGLLAWNKNYAIRIGAGAILGDGGAPFAGISDDTTWNFTTAAGDPLLDAIADLKAHIQGTTTLGASQIAGHKTTIDNLRNRFSESATTISAVFDLIQTYDTVKGPLWVARGQFSNRNTQPVDLDWTIYHVMQYIMDVIYTAPVLAAHEGLLNGFKFGSHANFPGPCPPPADPSASHTLTIQGSFENTFGRHTLQWTLPARKPTGTYLAPGTIATVTVPPEIVNKGYQIRVGAHSWDLSGRPPVRRLDRATRLYPVHDTTIKVASPYGGGIYVEVPLGADAGLVDVTVTGAVRAPYFSAKGFHQTSLRDWLDTERLHPAPWADFQSDKYMMQVPTKWIYAHPDPVKLMAGWDATMDAMNDLMGFPQLRGKETMYCQVDVTMRSSVHAPGYPAVNVMDNPTTERGGYHNNYLVRGPGNNYHSANIELHEQGHGYLFPKFGGETEANVNLPHVPAMHRKFGYSLDEAFRGSLGETNANRTLNNTAVAWMCVFNFSPRKAPMADGEKAYQLKGHAKFVDIARLFGWDGLGDYWRSFMEDNANGVSYTTNTDALLLRLSRNVGRDIRPLFHFWGIFPQNNSTLGAALAAEGILPSPEIRDLLLYYKTLVPANNAAFRTFAQAWWGKPPSINGYWEEREHARQWDTAALYNSGDQQRSEATNPGEIYNENSANDIRNRVQELVDLYFPGGIIPNPMGFSTAPAAVDAGTIGMTATTAIGVSGAVEYQFQNTTTDTLRDWDTSLSWTQSGLTPGQSYAYRVRARDGAGNISGWSATASAVPQEDLTPPAPDPMGFVMAPVAQDGTSITMTAITASDVNGVQYAFENTAGGGNDSGWQDDPAYTDTGLITGVAYTYRVRARDKSGNGNTTAWSAPATAVAGGTADTLAPQFVSLDPANGSSTASPESNLTMIFNENVMVGSGFITLRNLTDHTETPIAVTDASQVAFTAEFMTLTPAEGLAAGRSYAVRIDATAIQDLAGNPFAGIGDDSTWAFITAAAIIANPYGDWAQGFTGLIDSDPAADFDKGGLATALEWVLGGDPTDPSDDAGILPTLDATPDEHGKMRFVFRRAKAAHEDPNTTIQVVYGSNPGGWTLAEHQCSCPYGITITEEPDGYGPGLDRVIVALPADVAENGKLFARLKVEIATP